MDELSKTQPDEENVPKFRGLYRYVKIPVKALDAIIVVCIVAIVVVFALEMINPGFTISFDSNGGTDVQGQHQMYGEKLEIPEPPSREGYTFTGWYKDPACNIQWDAESDTIETDMTLYAGWEKIE